MKSHLVHWKSIDGNQVVLVHRSSETFLSKLSVTNFLKQILNKLRVYSVQLAKVIERS